MIVNITAYPRLHFTLIGMNQGGYRINGGIGLAIAEPTLKLKITNSNHFEFIDKRGLHFSKSQTDRLESKVNSIVSSKQLKNNISVELLDGMRSNSGFGSGTIIRLACLEALHIINDCFYTEDELVKLSGRGGTSGIGIRTYFRGGFVFDIGHKALTSHTPSSLNENQNHKSLLVDCQSSPTWEFGICIPNDIATLSHEEEVTFFKTVTPIPNEAVYMTLYHVVYGLYASLREHDIESFVNCIKEIQGCTWKMLEKNIYGPRLMEYEKQLYRCGAKAVGMSSLGPTLFFISDNNVSVIRNMAKQYPLRELSLFNSSTINEGRTITICKS